MDRFLIIILFVSLCLANVVTEQGKKIDFLIKYGYLKPPKAGGHPEPYSDDVMSKAIKLAQKYGGIPETGIYDNRTMRLFNSRRCGVPDPLNGANYVITHPWRKTQITYRYLTYYTNSLEKDVVKTEISKAFNAWASASPLKFSETQDPKATDIEIGFFKDTHNDKYPFDGWRGVLAHAFPPGPGLGGDLHFDEAEFWAVDPGWFFSLFRVDLYTVAVHELGHCLGLDHSLVDGAIMNPYYKKGGEITEDDKNGIKALYGAGP